MGGLCGPKAAEKAVKALVQAFDGETRGHSVTGPLERLAGSIGVPEGVLDAARDLDQIYITSRYPNGFPEGAPADYFSERTSQRLLSHARSIVEFCRSKIH